jgi:hypothetical protein
MFATLRVPAQAGTSGDFEGGPRLRGDSQTG